MQIHTERQREIQTQTDRDKQDQRQAGEAGSKGTNRSKNRYLDRPRDRIRLSK